MHASSIPGPRSEESPTPPHPSSGRGGRTAPAGPAPCRGLDLGLRGRRPRSWPEHRCRCPQCGTRRPAARPRVGPRRTCCARSPGLKPEPPAPWPVERLPRRRRRFRPARFRPDVATAYDRSIQRHDEPARSPRRRTTAASAPVLPRRSCTSFRCDRTSVFRRRRRHPGSLGRQCSAASTRCGTATSLNEQTRREPARRFLKCGSAGSRHDGYGRPGVDSQGCGQPASGSARVWPVRSRLVAR
jgi:hypothetical protein